MADALHASVWLVGEFFIPEVAVRTQPQVLLVWFADILLLRDVGTQLQDDTSLTIGCVPTASTNIKQQRRLTRLCCLFFYQFLHRETLPATAGPAGIWVMEVKSFAI